eukprot:2765778-Prymnesium_polylepis.1
MRGKLGAAETKESAPPDRFGSARRWQAASTLGTGGVDGSGGEGGGVGGNEGVADGGGGRGGRGWEKGAGSALDSTVLTARRQRT